MEFLFAKRRLATLLVLALTLATGCRSQRPGRGNIMMRPPYPTAPVAPIAQPVLLTVSVLGPVANPSIQWAAGLTLARALLVADYRGRNDPTAITIVRGGERFTVDPRRLLNGHEDPVLEPGDLVELHQ